MLFATLWSWDGCFDQHLTLVERRCSFILFIVVFFFLGWGPYNVAIFLDSLISWKISPFNDCKLSESIDYLIYVSRMVAFSHCCLNPVFYVFMGIKFRNHLKKMLQTFCKNTESNAEPQNRQTRLIYSNVKKYLCINSLRLKNLKNPGLEHCMYWISSTKWTQCKVSVQ